MADSSEIKLTGQAKADFESQAIPHLDALYRVALRMCRDPAQADDLVQETFLKAFRAFHTFEAGSNIRAWLFKILSNVFLTGLRKKKGEPGKTSLDEVLPFIEDKKSTKSDDLDEGDPHFKHVQDPWLRSAIEELPEDYRLVILLVIVEGFSYKEAAHIVSAPIGTVMSRLHRAKKALKEKLLRKTT